MADIIDINDKKYLGVTVSDYIEKLASSDSRLHKEAVLEQALTSATLGAAQGQAFLYNLFLACNPYYTYGVKQIPKTEGLVGKPNNYLAFWKLAEDLLNRRLTGHAARDAIKEVSEQFDSTEWNLMCRAVLVKDLRCGVSETTVNKIVGKTQYRIPKFTCQLASSSDDNQSKMKGVKRIECKLDGVRVLAVCTKHTVALFSRNGKQFENFPDIVEQISKIKNRISLETKGPFVLDGEVIGKSFQELMKQAHRKKDVETKDMTYYIFDIIPLADFERGFWNAQQHKRLLMLDINKQEIESQDNLRLMPGMDVDLDSAEGHDVMRRFAEDAVKEGFEGIMIKDLGAPYECKRSSFWMKWKPVITVDLTVTKVEEGTGRNQGRLGNFICEGNDDNRFIRVSVGSGFSDSDRDSYWSSANDIVGQVVEVMADAVTQNQDGSYSLRFPRFVRFRGFEPGEKI